MEYFRQKYDDTKVSFRTCQYEPHHSIAGQHGIFIYELCGQYRGELVSAEQFLSKRDELRASFPNAIMIGFNRISAEFGSAVLTDMRNLNSGDAGKYFRRPGSLIQDLERVILGQEMFPPPQSELLCSRKLPPHFNSYCC